MNLKDSKEKSANDQVLNLNIPNPPDNIAYWEVEDFRNREILKANGISLSEVELITALAKTRNVLRTAATHTLGCLASRAAIAIFKDLLTSSEDLVKVESAYALARLGVFEGKEVLVQCLEYPLDAYLFPAIAAGYLAQLGDPQGFNTIVKCFGVDISAIRMLACKQLYFFVPFHGGIGQSIFSSINLPGIYYTGKITGMLFSTPFLLFAAILVFPRKSQEEYQILKIMDSFRWMVLLLSGVFQSSSRLFPIFGWRHASLQILCLRSPS